MRRIYGESNVNSRRLDDKVHARGRTNHIAEGYQQDENEIMANQGGRSPDRPCSHAAVITAMNWGTYSEDCELHPRSETKNKSRSNSSVVQDTILKIISYLVS